MNKRGPIIIVEDDADDRELLEMAFEELDYPNKIVFFEDAGQALAYLENPSINPFLVLSDINMPKMDGFEMKRRMQLDGKLSNKSIPYLFFSTAVNSQSVTEAYQISAQGYFLKSHSYDHLVNTLRKIVEYWQECYSPNKLR